MSIEEIYEYEKKYERVSKETEQYGRTQFVGKIIELEQQLQAYRNKDQDRSWCSKKEVNDLINESAKYRQQLQAYKEKEDKLREYVKDLKEDALKDLSEVEIKYAFDCIIFALNKILDGSDE